MDLAFEWSGGLISGQPSFYSRMIGGDGPTLDVDLVKAFSFLQGMKQCCPPIKLAYGLNTFCVREFSQIGESCINFVSVSPICRRVLLLFSRLGSLDLVVTPSFV